MNKLYMKQSKLEIIKQVNLKLETNKTN